MSCDLGLASGDDHSSPDYVRFVEVCIMLFCIWRNRFVVQGIPSALQYFIIMLSCHTFHLFHIFAAICDLKFALVYVTFLNFDNVLISFAALTTLDILQGKNSSKSSPQRFQFIFKIII